MALSEDFEGACLAFAHVAESYQRSNLLRPNLPSVLLRAGLCLIADGGPIQGGLYTHTVQREGRERAPSPFFLPASFDA